jgi:hypothetical protein
VAHHQNQKFAKQHEPQPVVVDQPAPSDDLVGRLQQLADLKASGALNEKEFAAAKARLLQG